MKRHLWLALIIFAVGCSRAKDTVIPPDVKDWDSLKPAIESLEQGDREVFMRYVLRTKMEEAFSKKATPSRTIGEAISEQKNMEAERAVKEAEEKALQDKLKAERDAMRAKLEGVLTAVLIEKDFHKADYEKGEYQDKFEYVFGFKNNGSQGLKGFKAKIVFLDIFGDEIKSINLSYDEPIAAGATVQWAGTSNFNQFESEDVKLRDTDSSKTKLRLDTEKVLFADGTKLEMPESSPF